MSVSIGIFAILAFGGSLFNSVPPATKNSEKTDAVPPADDIKSLPPVNVVPLAASVDDEPNLTRVMYPFEINMHNYTSIYNALQGLNDTNIRVAYYNSSYQWNIVPFEIDERGNPLTWVGGGTVDNSGLFWSWPSWVTATLQPTSSFIPYGDPYGHGNKTWYNGTVVPTRLIGHICDNDELLFYAYNGRKVDSTLWWNSTSYPNRIEVQIQDPVDGGHSWMYIYYNNATSFEPIKSDPWYVNYVNWTPANLTVTTPVYSMALSSTYPDTNSFIGIHQGSADGQNLIAQDHKTIDYVYMSASGYSTNFGFGRVGTWPSGDNFSNPGTLTDLATALHDPSRGTSGNSAEGNLQNCPGWSGSGSGGSYNNIAGAGDHQAISNGPIRVIIGHTTYQGYKIQLGSALAGAGILISSYGYGTSYYYYGMTQTDNSTTSVPYNAAATVTLAYTFQAVVQFNNTIRSSLQINSGCELNNPNSNSFGSSRIISTVPDGSLAGDGYTGAGDPTAQITGAPPVTGWSPTNVAVPDWVFLNSTSHGGLWMLIPRTALAQLNAGTTDWYWHDTPTCSEMGLALGNVAGGATTSPYYMRTVFGEFKNVANMTYLGSLLYNDTFQQLNGISTFNQQYCPPSQPIFQSISPDSLVYKSGQNITLSIQCDHAGYSLTGNFSSIDSGYSPANVFWTDNGGGSYTMMYQITTGNTRADGVYRIIVNATNVTTTTTSSSNSTELQLYNNIAIISIIATAGTPTTVNPGDTNIPVNVSIQNTGGGNLNITAIHWKFSIGGMDTTSNYTVNTGPNPQFPYTLMHGGTAVWFNYTVNIAALPMAGLTTIDATADGLDLVLLTPIHNNTGAATKDTWTVASVALPSITSPSNFGYEIGTTGHSISWTITVGSGTWWIYRNSVQINSSTWTTGQMITQGVDGNGVGIYNYTIKATSSGGTSQDECDVTVANTAPVVTTPSAFSYYWNTVGHTITWTVTDPSVSSPAYTVYRNSMIVKVAAWASGVGIVYNVDGLSLGSYNFTITASDGYTGANASANATNECDVTVLNHVPVVTTTTANPYTYVAGSTGNALQWTITDPATSGATYTIYKNSIAINSSLAWVSPATVTDDIDGWAVGTYNVTIVANDGLGLSNQNQVNVTVTSGGLPPSVTPYPNIMYEIGTTSHVIQWSISGTPNSGTYVIYRNHISVNSGSWVGGTNVTWNVDGNGVGFFNYTLVATNAAGFSQGETDASVANTAPIISAPASFSYYWNTIGNTITWTVTDPSTSGATYTVFQNSTIVKVAAWVSGVGIIYPVDGLPVGSYNFTITASDGFAGANASANATNECDVTVLIHVLVVTTTTANPYTYVVGSTGNVIQWTITDLATSGATFTIYQNGVAINSSLAWVSPATVTDDIDGWAAGTYNVTIVANDGLGLSNQNEVDVTVNNYIAPTISGLDQLLASIVADWNKGTPISVTVIGTNVTSVVLGYQMTGTIGTIELNMTSTSPTIYSATIPSAPYGRIVLFMVNATDGTGTSVMTAWYNFTIGDHEGPTINNVGFSKLLADIIDGDSVNVNVSVSEDVRASGVRSVVLFYSTNGGTDYTAVNLVPAGDVVFGGALPSFPAGTHVSLKIVVTDFAGNVATKTFDYTIGQKPLDIVGILVSPYMIIGLGALIAVALVVKQRSRAKQIERFFGKEEKAKGASK